MKKLIADMVKSPYNRKWIAEYYELKSDHFPVLDFIREIDNEKLSAKIIMMIDVLEAEGIFLKEPYCKHINNGIYELRIRQATNIARIFYFFDSDRIILTNGYIKKKNKISDRDYERALLYRAKYYERKDHGDTYTF